MRALCDIPSAGGTGCCDSAPTSALAPVRPSNPPGLTRIRYRIGTFRSFKSAMLADLAGWMPALRSDGANGGYASVLIELWAYIADVLTLYQEQIANEAFLPTAVQRSSLFRLAELIGYRPQPGAAATGLLAFSLGPGKVLAIPDGFRAANKPAGGQPAVTFETDAPITARAEHNRMPLATTAPANQFAPLSAIDNALASPLPQFTTRADLDQFRKDLDTVFAGLGDDIFQSTGLQSQDAIPAAGTSASPSAATTGSRTIRIVGINRKIRQGDYLLILDRFDATGAARGPGALREISRVVEDRVGGTTSVTFVERSAYAYALADPQVFIFRVKGAPFGADAPEFKLISPYLSQTSVTPFGTNNPIFSRDWGRSITLPDTTDTRVLDLDRVYDTVVPTTAEMDSWVALLDTRTNEHHARRIVAVNQKTRSDYMLTGRVTELTLDGAINAGAPPPPTFYLRTTLVLLQSERLPLADDRPLPEPVGGSTVILAGAYPNLRPGQAIIISGAAYDPTAGAASGPPIAQDAIIDTVRTDTRSVITLRRPLNTALARSTATVSGNVAPASQGETVRDEVLGSGNSTSWQRYGLRKQPLTYVPATSGDSPVASTIHVTVNGVRWEERSDLSEAAPQDRVFAVAHDAANASSVFFGDGVNGARPPTGRDNIHARYRFGIGAAGDLAAGAISRLVDSRPGLLAVTNPEPTLGGADPERDDAVRRNAPGSLRTFGRAVAVDDYSAIALTFPGIARARAAWIYRDDSGMLLAHPAIYVAVATENRVPLAQQGDYAARLRAFLDNHRDPNVPMRLVDAGRVYVDVAAVVDVDASYPRHATLRAAQAALNPATNPDGSTGFFGRLDFGEAVHLSSIYAALQEVPGVSAANVTTLRLPQPDPPGRPQPDPPGTVRDHVLVPPSAIAFVANDSSDRSNAYGKTSVDLGVGGFED